MRADDTTLVRAYLGAGGNPAKVHQNSREGKSGISRKWIAVPETNKVEWESTFALMILSVSQEQWRAGLN